MKDIKSMEDLKGRASEFKGRIVGIEPRRRRDGPAQDKLLPGYGLDKEYKLIDGSTPSMLAELKRAYAKKEPIVVPLWSPHWAYNDFDLTKLKDPRACGARATASTPWHARASRRRTPRSPSG